MAATVLAGLAWGCGGSTSTTISEITGPDALRCQTALSTTPSTVPHGGTRVTLTVMAERECAWTATSDASWAQITPTSGQGETPVTVTIAANPAAQARSAAIVINDTRLSLTQEAAPCRFQLERTHDRMSHGAGRTTVGVLVADGCAWRATSNAPAWARVVTDSGTGSGAVHVEVSLNPGRERTAVITIADQTFTLVQEGRPASAPAPGPSPGPAPPPNPACTITLDRAEQSFGAPGGNGSVRVEAPAGCAWTASTSASWIDISGSNGTGPDTVRYSVESNASTSPRTAIISVAGRTHTVRQNGAPAGGGGGGGGGGGERVDVSGRALLVEGSCPNLSFVVAFRRVFTNGDTRFRGRCSRIRNGTEVSVEGRVQPDGRVRATEVRVRGDDDGDDDDDRG